MKREINCVAFIYILINAVVAAVNRTDYCYGDLCNMYDTPHFCDEFDHRCHPCIEKLNDCERGEVPSGCIDTCIDYRTQQLKKAVKEQPCPPLPTVDHGTFNTSSSDQLVLKYTVTLTCEPGYRPFGEATIRCIGYGLWSSKVPICKVLRCPPPPKLKNGQWLSGSEDSEYIYGHELLFSCRKGYKLNGPELWNCSSSGVWLSSTSTNEMPVCIKEDHTFLGTNFWIALVCFGLSFYLLKNILRLIPLCLLRFRWKTKPKKHQYQLLPGSLPTAKEMNLPKVNPDRHKEAKDQHTTCASPLDIGAMNSNEIPRQSFNINISNNICNGHASAQPDNVSTSTAYTEEDETTLKKTTADDETTNDSLPNNLPVQADNTFEPKHPSSEDCKGPVVLPNATVDAKSDKEGTEKGFSGIMETQGDGKEIS